MQRAARAVARIGAHGARLVQSPSAAKSVRSAFGAVPAAVSVWPPVQPSLSASTTSTTGTNSIRAAGTADGLLDMLGDDEDETRFRKRKDKDRGPPRARRESARDSDRRGGGGGGGGGDRRDGGRVVASRAPAGAAGSDDNVTEEDLLSLSPNALRMLPPHIADALQSSSSSAHEVPFPYDEEVSPLAAQRAAMGARYMRLGTHERTLTKEDMPEDSGALIETTMRELDRDEAKILLHAMKEDAVYTGPTMHAVVAGDGSVMPLDEEDEDRINKLAAFGPRSIPPALLADPAARAALVLRATLLRRALRATYSEEEIARMAAVAVLQRQETGPLSTTLKPFQARRENVYRKGTDPLLDTAGVLPFSTRRVTFVSNMTWNASPNAAGVDRRASIVAKAAGLGLDQATLSWLVAIAGPRYDAASGQLKLSSEFHPTGAANKRAVLETMVALVQEAKGLGDKHGALPTKKVMPKYAHA